MDYMRVCVCVYVCVVSCCLFCAYTVPHTTMKYFSLDDSMCLESIGCSVNERERETKITHSQH